jgi:hypothetical protein
MGNGLALLSLRSFYLYRSWICLVWICFWGVEVMFCQVCKVQKVPTRLGDSVFYHCNCDLTFVEGHSVATNDVDLTEALSESLRLCGVDVSDPFLQATAGAEA